MLLRALLSHMQSMAMGIRGHMIAICIHMYPYVCVMNCNASTQVHEDGRRLNAEHCRSFYFASSLSSRSSSGLEHLMRQAHSSMLGRGLVNTRGARRAQAAKAAECRFRMAVSRNS